LTGFAVLSVLLAFLTAAIGATVLLVDWLPDFLRRRRRAKRIRDGLERRPTPPPPGASNDEVLAYMYELFGDRTGSEIMDDEELRAELFRLARERRATDDAGVTAAG
jgi:hypothetical protein